MSANWRDNGGQEAGLTLPTDHPDHSTVSPDQWPPGLGPAPALHVNRVVCLSCATVIGRALTPRCANGAALLLSRPSTRPRALGLGREGAELAPATKEDLGNRNAVTSARYRTALFHLMVVTCRSRSAPGDYGGEKLATEDRPGESRQPVRLSRHVQLKAQQTAPRPTAKICHQDAPIKQRRRKHSRTQTDATLRTFRRKGRLPTPEGAQKKSSQCVTGRKGCYFRQQSGEGREDTWVKMSLFHQLMGGDREGGRSSTHERYDGKDSGDKDDPSSDQVIGLTGALLSDAWRGTLQQAKPRPRTRPGDSFVAIYFRVWSAVGTALSRGQGHLQVSASRAFYFPLTETS
ncbi:hypothetical protein Bbelb_411870 [Branchiostoma belcheri]|nr:hypothetical protein Bbelb_411870 [Branchiostoma belcheri]